MYSSMNPGNKMKGTYILVLKQDSNIRLNVGNIGELKFEPGYYIYVGSALNGIEKRVKRHFSKEKKLWWHIDYLTLKAIPLYAIGIPGYGGECELARLLSNLMEPVKNFGSSDCKCSSHLLKTRKEPKEDIMRVLKQLNLCWKGLFIIPNYWHQKKWL